MYLYESWQTWLIVVTAKVRLEQRTELNSSRLSWALNSPQAQSSIASPDAFVGGPLLTTHPIQSILTSHSLNSDSYI